MIDFQNTKSIIMPEGEVAIIARGEEILWQKPGLPFEYQEVEYIIVPAAAWFDTGIVPSGDKWTYETEMYAASWGSNQYFYFAVRETKNYNTMYAPIHVTSGYRMYLNGNVKTASAGGAKNTWYKIKSEIQDGLQNMWINDVLKVTDNIPITTTYTLPLYLFAANFHGGMYQGTAGRIKYLKASKGNELVRDFIPCYRKSDGEAGLYDLVTETFFTNKGTGKITCGEAV